MNKLLSFFGLVRKSEVRDLTIEPFTDEELNQLTISSCRKNSEGFDSSAFDLMVDLLKKNPEFAKFCDWTISNDVERAFGATEEERHIIRGAVSRTRYLKSLSLFKENSPKSMKKIIKRYG